MEGVFLAGFGDMGHKLAQDVGRDEAIATGKGPVGPELLLDPFVGGELAQALGDLPAVLDREKPQVAGPLAEHEVVCLPDLFRGGSEGGEGVGVARACEFPDYAIEVAWVGADGGHLSGVVVDFIVPGSHVGRWLDGRDLRFPAIGLVCLL